MHSVYSKVCAFDLLLNFDFDFNPDLNMVTSCNSKSHETDDVSSYSILEGLILNISSLFHFQHSSEYISILSGVNGGANEKRLASQFIVRFFKYFPDLHEKAIDAQLDLCEDEDVAVSWTSLGYFKILIQNFLMTFFT